MEICYGVKHECLMFKDQRQPHELKKNNTIIQPILFYILIRYLKYLFKAHYKTSSPDLSPPQVLGKERPSLPPPRVYDKLRPRRISSGNTSTVETSPCFVMLGNISDGTYCQREIPVLSQPAPFFLAFCLWEHATHRKWGLIPMMGAHPSYWNFDRSRSIHLWADDHRGNPAGF